MGIADEVSAAFTEAQGYLAQTGGMAEDATGNFVGPNGQTYTMVFRSADAYESQAMGAEMQQHGYADKSLVIATATRDQFDAIPLGWKRAHGTRLVPAPAQDVTIMNVATDDPHHYVFAMVLRQTSIAVPSNG